MSRREPMCLDELRGLISGLPGAADIQVHLPDGRTLDIESIDFVPADKSSVLDHEPTVNIWLSE